MYIGPGQTEEFLHIFAAKLSSVLPAGISGVDVHVHPLLKGGSAIIVPAGITAGVPSCSVDLSEIASRIQSLLSSGSDTKLT